ncbi:MAG: hypothetical protein OXQ89_12295 [Rhodospirillaceae bacterium]|nr:hypothetical protein [Rhodospirillaceae bacterium]
MVDSAVRNVIGFVVAVLAATVFASIISTQFVIAGLQETGVEVPFGNRVSMTVTDLALLRIYLIMGGTAMLVAFVVAGACARWLRGSRQVWFAVAGFAALTCVLMLVESLLGAMLIAGARTVPGLLLQGVAGAFGGWVFARLTSDRKATT